MRWSSQGSAGAGAGGAASSLGATNSKAAGEGAAGSVGVSAPRGTPPTTGLRVGPRPSTFGFRRTQVPQTPEMAHR